MKGFFKLILKVFGFFTRTLWICFMFLIVYGVLRELIDKLIEKFKSRKKKEEIISELLKTEEGRENLATSMTGSKNE